MAWRQIGEKPLSQPMQTRFSDTFMRHYGEIILLKITKVTHFFAFGTMPFLEPMMSHCDRALRTNFSVQFQSEYQNKENSFENVVTGDLLHSRALAHSCAPLFTQPCPIVHTAVPRENNEHGCVYLRCRAVCKLPGCVEGHPWLSRYSIYQNKENPFQNVICKWQPFLLCASIMGC